MIWGRRTRETDVNDGHGRLVWDARRHGEDLRISVRPPVRQDERGFRPVDALGQAHATEPAAALASALTRAAEAGEAVALQGFAAPRPGRAALTFVLAVSLADIPHPEAADLPEGNVSPFDLPCGPGLRVQRLAREHLEPEPGADEDERPAEIMLFTATYLAQTEHGVIALAFATPHVDGAPEFAVLFDSVAGSCAVEVA